MFKSSSIDWRNITRNPQSAVRAGLGVLLLANLVAAWFVFQTPGGSLDELESEVASTTKQLNVRRQMLGKVTKDAELVGKARDAGLQFMGGYFLDRRSAYSTLEMELSGAARNSGVKPRDRSINEELIDGSDKLGMLTLNANFEGNYMDLIEFVNALDRSHRLLIIDQMAAQPQQAGGLAINLKINAFYREEGSE